MKLSSIIILFAIVFFILPACSDQVRDEFPKRTFIGYFDLRDPRYSQDVFTATHDVDGTYVGINGIIVYRASNNQFYAFDQMCPHEKKSSCSAKVDMEEDPNIAECECCGSKFWIIEPNGTVAEGPATRGLQSYTTKIDGQWLVVSSY